MGDVKEFSNELNSLYNVKPPISRAKMTSITRLALKSLKHYKHVVQSIEKFIHKCQAEYKLPGLYVIDSIVRQSRHQFGADKDPFAGRFSRNIAVTFHNLLSCPSQEICKIVRVLNLWQKNSMFPPQIIQPLLDMAANPNSQEVYMEAQKAIQQVTGSSSVQQHTQIKSFSEMPSTSDLSGDLSQSADLLKALSSQLLLPLFTNPQLYLQLLQQQLLVQQATTGNLMPELQHSFVPQIDSNLMAQIQALTAALMARIGTPQQQPQTNQQASNTATTANAGIMSNLDTTTDSLQSSDFHGDFTSPIFSNKKAGLSDIVSDIEDDKVADQMSISSISTPAINTTEVPDGGLGSGAGPAYSPSADHTDNGQLVTSSTHHVILSEPTANALLVTDASLLPSCAPSVHPETSAVSKSSILNSCSTENVTASRVHKNDYTLFSPVSPINSVPNSPSEESGTPVLDEIPSPKNFQGNCLMIGEEEKKSMIIEECAMDNVGQFPSNDMEVLDELQTPEEGEILANETEAGELDYIDYSATRDKRKRKRSKRSKDKREKSKVGNSNRRPESSRRYPESKVESLLKGRKETKITLGKKDKESKKKRKRHKERTSSSGGRADLGKISRRSSTSMADQTLVVEDEPRRYFVVLDELPEPAHHDLKKSKRKRSRSPESTSAYSSARMSRKDLFVTRENVERVHDRQEQKRHRVESVDDMVKDKKRRHSKEELHGNDKPKKVSSSIDRALPNPPSLVTSNGPSSHHHTSTSRKDRSKSSRNRSPRKDSKNKNSKDKSHEPVKATRTAVKNRIYRAKSISAEPVASTDRKSRSRSKEKKSARKGSNHKSSKRSPVKQKEESSSRKKEDKSKSSHKSEGVKGSKNDRSKTRVEKDKDENKHSKSSTSSSSGGDKDEASKKEKCHFPPVKDNHACVCSTTLWIGPIGRHTKKDELKKELNKYSKPILIDVVTKQSCVHVAFETRKEAADLMNVLNGTVLCGKTVKVTWAPGSGIKQSKFLKRWDVELGATYIPWDKLPYNMEAITQGGILDTNSMPPPVVSATVVLPESKEKENSTRKSSSSIGLVSLDLNVENEHGPSKVSKKKPGEGNECKLSEILLPLEVTNKESVENESLTGQDTGLNEKETVEDDLSSISLPPLPPPPVIEPIIDESLPVLAKHIQGSSIESEIIVVQDELTEDLDSSHINKVLEVETMHSPLIRKADDAKDESEKESNKSVTTNKFSFSIDNHNSNPEKLDTLKKRSDIESEIESNSTIKVSELGAADDLQASENVTAKMSVPTDKKASKISKPEILKGKIKFGVISAFSGWANKQKLSATTQPVTTSTEEKQKDARILYETLMERISSKTSKADQKAEVSSMAVTFDEDFLSTIKVPSPKSTLMEASKIDENKSRSMSEVYDPFENYSDSGDNSPVNKLNTSSSHNNQVAIMGLSHTPLINSSQSLIFSQNFGLNQGQCPSLANNVSLPPYHQPPIRLNTSLNCLPTPTQGIAPVASIPMAMPLSNNLILQPSNTPIPNSSSALIGSNHPANSLLPPPGFMPQQTHHHPPIAQNPIIAPTTVRHTVINSTFPSMTSSRVPPFDQTQPSFNVPPPVISLNRLASSSFPPLPDNSKHLPVTTTLMHFPVNAITTSSMTFPHPQSAAYPSMGFPNTASLLMNSALNHNVSNALGAHIHRRPPLLSEPPANPVPQMSANVPPVHIWTSGLPNPPTTQGLQNSCTSGSTPGINSSQSVESLRTTDWFRNSAPGATASHMAPLLSSQNTSFAMKPRSHFITNTQAPIQAGYNQNHLDYSNKDSSMIGNHPWKQPSNNTSNYGGIADVSRQCSKLPIMCNSNIDKTTASSSTGSSSSISAHRDADMKTDGLKYTETSSNMSNADRGIDYHVLPKSGAVDEDGEPIFKIESVVSNTKLQSEVGNKASNLIKPFSESLTNQERLPAPPAFFNVPPPTAPPQQIKGSISTIMASQGPPTASVSNLMGVRAPHGIAQEFSKLLNSPVTFDGFSKNLPPRDQVRMVGNANLNPNFVQRPTSCNNNSLLGPPPPNNNFNPLNKTNHLPSVAPSLPNDFNRNLPPPLLPQQMGMRNMLVPGAVDRSNKNSELRFPLPPLLNPSDFVNSLQPNLRHEPPQRQARFADRDHERRNADRQEGSGPRFPRKPFNHSREQKYRFRNESSRFYVRGGSSHYN